MTFELGRIRTWRFPAFSALLMAFSASFKTLVRTMTAVFEWSRVKGKKSEVRPAAM